MCGIVGYVGRRDAYPILIKGLHRLEYRGYDSAGLAMVDSRGDLNVYKCKGKVSALENFVEGKDLDGVCGIAHTRWATHGEPNSTNAHPHYSCSENIAIIHNGIIENWSILKDALIKEGYTFKSQTDTEVLVNLIEYVRNTNRCTLLEAVQGALKQVIGAYAIAVVEKGHDDEIIVARQSSPLVVGIGDGEYFLASDATPIVEYTDRVVYLEDGEIAVLHRGRPLKVVNFDNDECPVDVCRLKMNISELEKGGYKHFMLKEIHEQPKTILDCMRGRVSPESYDVILSGIRDNAYRFLSARRIVIVACGTSWHAGLIGKQLIEHYCKIPVEVDYASEFRYRDPVIYPTDVVIAISQSGETADTLAAMREAKRKGARTVAIVNVVSSSIAREADAVLYTWAGPEIAVATTKAYSAQLAALYLVAVRAAYVRGTLSEEQARALCREVAALPEQIEKTLECRSQMQHLASLYANRQSVFFIGRGMDYAAGQEASLKLKEISYIHSEAYAAGELKHGTISLIEEGTMVVALACDPALTEKTVSNVKSVKARGASVVLVTSDQHLQEDPEICDHLVRIPAVNPQLSASLSILPMQLLAYYTAVIRGCDVDKPRNLAKSVTVE